MEEDTEQPRIIRIKETDSTNRYLREINGQEKLPEGSIVVAGYQTAGRGQTGNSWESEPDENLLFSIVLFPDCIPANRQFLISQIASLAVKRTLDNYTSGITVKWPNDIYRNEKKICGMLIENDLSGTSIYSSIIGIGININQSGFRSQAPNPVSLKQITGKTYNLEKILEVFRNHFYTLYLSLLKEEHDEIRKAYMDALYRKEGFHSFSDEKGCFEARIYAIEDTGHLLLEDNSGAIRRYAFKEVTFLPEKQAES